MVTQGVKRSTALRPPQSKALGTPIASRTAVTAAMAERSGGVVAAASLTENSVILKSPNRRSKRAIALLLGRRIECRRVRRLIA